MNAPPGKRFAPAGNRSESGDQAGSRSSVIVPQSEPCPSSEVVRRFSDVVVLDADGARRLTERIRYTALGVRDGMEKLHRLVQEAKDGEAHVALGYASWTAYLSDVLGAEPLRLPRDQRQELVGYLSGEGMSTRAIAPIVGVTDRHVRRDLEQVGPNVPPVASSPVESRPAVDPDTGEVAGDYPEPPPSPVTGLDGKTYTRPQPTAAPRAPQRRALTDDARDAGIDLRKAIDRLERLAADDRLTRNRDEVAAHLRYHLDRALTVCQDLSNNIINQSGGGAS